MKKVCLALLLVAILMISVFGTTSAAAQSSNHSSVPIIDREASFSGSYTGHEVARTADNVAITSTRGTYKNTTPFSFHFGQGNIKNTMTGEGSGIAEGQFFGSQTGSYTADIQATLTGRLIGKSVDGTCSAIVTISGVQYQVKGPFHGTFDGRTMNVRWSSHVVQKDDGSIIVTDFKGFVEFVMAP